MQEDAVPSFPVETNDTLGFGRWFLGAIFDMSNLTARCTFHVLHDMHTFRSFVHSSIRWIARHRHLAKFIRTLLDRVMTLTVMHWTGINWTQEIHAITQSVDVHFKREHAYKVRCKSLRLFR